MVSGRSPYIRPTQLAEPDCVYRDSFLQATGQLGITREQATALVESLSGHTFEDCGWTELEPAIHQLQHIVDRLLADARHRRSGCK